MPIFSLQRVEGRIFAPLAHTVVSALVGALLVSFTLVPVLCFFALRRPKRVQKISPLLSWSQRALRSGARAGRCATAGRRVIACGWPAGRRR